MNTTAAHTTVIAYDRDDYDHAICSCGWATFAGDSADTARRLRGAVDFHLNHHGVAAA